MVTSQDQVLHSQPRSTVILLHGQHIQLSSTQPGLMQCSLLLTVNWRKFVFSHFFLLLYAKDASHDRLWRAVQESHQQVCKIFMYSETSAAKNG